jgi:hypothetical protein
VAGITFVLTCKKTDTQETEPTAKTTNNLWGCLVKWLLQSLQECIKCGQQKEQIGLPFEINSKSTKQTHDKM